MSRPQSRTVLLMVAALVTLGLPARATACEFCVLTAPPWRSDFRQADLVLFGRFTNATIGDADGLREGGTTDLVVEKVLKRHEIIGSRKTVTIPKYLPTTKSKWLVFCTVRKGKIDPFHGIEFRVGGDPVKYLTGILDARDQSVAARLRYCFEYLNDREPEIALDAYREFAVAHYNDYRDLARKLPADRIAGWLEDPKTPPYRFGLYASLLGHCGSGRHAKVYRRLLESKQEQPDRSIHGLLVGYTLLKPNEGWAYLRDHILGRPELHVSRRNAGLRAVRFLWETRPDVVPRKELQAGLCLLLKQKDLADFAIEDLRKWHCWDVADKVLALAGKESADLPLLRRTVLRYALCCPKKSARAQEFIRAERKKDPETVAEIEDMLRLDAVAPSRR